MSGGSQIVSDIFDYGSDIIWQLTTILSLVSPFQSLNAVAVPILDESTNKSQFENHTIFVQWIKVMC